MNTKTPLAIISLTYLFFCSLISLPTHSAATWSSVVAGEPYKVSWNLTAQTAVIWEYKDGVRIGTLNKNARSATLRKKEPGRYMYRELRCHTSGCSEVFLGGAEVKRRPCKGFGDLYDYKDYGGCFVDSKVGYKSYGKGSVDIWIEPASAGSRYTNRLLYVIGGYDPGNGFESDEVISYIKNAAKGEPTDIVYMSFARTNNDHLQKKSLAMSTALKTIDTFRGSAKPSVLIGISLGGVIARHSLASLEKEVYDHGVRSFISFDSPHRGAHVPLGLQRLPTFLADAVKAAKDDNSGGINEVLDFFTLGSISRGLSGASQASDYASAIHEDYLGSPAAKQLLLQHVDASDWRHSLGLELQRELTALGYPRRSKNIAIANGSDSGKLQSVRSKSRYIAFQSTHNDVTLEFDSFVAGSNQSIGGALVGDRVFSGHLRYPDASRLGARDSFRRQFATSRPKLDIVPCSTTPIPSDIRDVLAPQLAKTWPNNSVQLYGTHSCFIPTLSALDIGQVPISRTSRVDLKTFSPFDEIYTQPDNLGHMALTNQLRMVLQDNIIRVYTAAPSHQVEDNLGEPKKSTPPPAPPKKTTGPNTPECLARCPTSIGQFRSYCMRSNRVCH